MENENTESGLLLKLLENTARMEGKLDAALPAVADHEQRIRKLEQHRWVQLGGVGLIGTLIAAWAQYSGSLSQ